MFPDLLGTEGGDIKLNMELETRNLSFFTALPVPGCAEGIFGVLQRVFNVSVESCIFVMKVGKSSAINSE